MYLRRTLRSIVQSSPDVALIRDAGAQLAPWISGKCLERNAHEWRQALRGMADSLGGVGVVDHIYVWALSCELVSCEL